MAKRIAVSTLNASTIDILNTIRQNASYEYQSQVPAVTKATDIPKVGDVLYGYPALANQFLNALINRIALVRVKSATFNNAYADLKKGYLEFGETVEEVFVNIAKAREFSAEKAEARELKRSLPDVRTALHAMNWRVQYPVTIQDEDLRQAFLSIEGVQDLIARIVDSVYTAAEYDEFLLFKYLIIKAVSHGKMKAIAFDAADMKKAAVTFRGTSNQLTFMSKNFNEAGVTTVTPKEDQYIFMDANFNAQYDVDVLSAAFNMDKADFMGHLKLIDDFTSFDNDRFSAITSASDMIEAVTDTELALMENVKAVLVDAEWFQVYDNQNKFTEKYVASGEYWNYFYNVWKTVSTSPFSNAVVFVDAAATTELPASVHYTAEAVSRDTNGVAFTFKPDPAVGLAPTDVIFEQSSAATAAGIAVHPYGAVVSKNASLTYTPTAFINGVHYTAKTAASGGNNYNMNMSASGNTANFYLVKDDVDTSAASSVAAEPSDEA